ncbi:MAG: hypothetical protein N3B10_15440, partial [Armatimonadetes bacterium]|nr:hypothetical protein [Armatimonadota bacterium]
MDHATTIIIILFLFLAMTEWSHSARWEGYLLNWLGAFLLSLRFSVENFVFWLIKVITKQNPFGLGIFLLGWTTLILFWVAAVQLDIPSAWLMVATLL